MASTAWRNEKRRRKEAERVEREEAEAAEMQERYEGVWGVPEAAISEFLAMEDSIGEHQARAVLEFVQAMMAQQ